ncbi:hypothetical protein ACLOJK_020249 [Asimina triloba]
MNSWESNTEKTGDEHDRADKWISDGISNSQRSARGGNHYLAYGKMGHEEQDIRERQRRSWNRAYDSVFLPHLVVAMICWRSSDRQRPIPTYPFFLHHSQSGPLGNVKQSNNRDRGLLLIDSWIAQEELASDGFAWIWSREGATRRQD